jgi:hypothetical protein
LPISCYAPQHRCRRRRFQHKPVGMGCGTSRSTPQVACSAIRMAPRVPLPPVRSIVGLHAARRKAARPSSALAQRCLCRRRGTRRYREVQARQ